MKNSLKEKFLLLNIAISRKKSKANVQSVKNCLQTMKVNENREN